MNEHTEAKINKIAETVEKLAVQATVSAERADHMEETVDELATLVVNNFERIDKKMEAGFEKVHEEIDEIKTSLHSTRMNTASEVELNTLKDRVKYLEDYVGKRLVIA